jgi:hypothetical protein
VQVNGASAKTDNQGIATVHTNVGNHVATISKTYYKTETEHVLVPLMDQKSVPSFELVATGRQVSLQIVNIINGSPVENALVSSLGSTARTDASGKTVIVLPAGKVNADAKITAPGYNDTNVSLKVIGAAEADNEFKMTPAGKVYFLSKLTGKIDVVKANLDGTSRETVFAGTGHESDDDTILLASRDWKYLALKSVRNTNNDPRLYLIKTDTGQITDIDTGSNVDFTPVGWHDNNFVYTVTRNNVKDWQPNKWALKTYNAVTGKLATIDQTAGSGSNEYNYKQQYFTGIYFLGNELVYAKNWNTSSYPLKIQFVSAKPDGSGKHVVKEFSPDNPNYFSVDVTPYEPHAVYIAAEGDHKTTHYKYENGTVKSASLTDQQFYKNYPTYLVSPNDQATFWSESRDGKNTLFTGDASAEHEKQIATLSDYRPYGWFTSQYLLVSKDDSELYVMPNTGGKPLKIADYHKPDFSSNGYGYGYGGY